ncbi:polysaccharide deacetylase family protein [Streptomyces sp. NPDC102364]|uniref:polysaccharide deacetylase family protein n=1 Tax=Streptomyces sp. NPDC102364 TaxID=3366161 RepID=UPI0038014CAA
MIKHVRRVTAACALGALALGLAGCGEPASSGVSGATRPTGSQENPGKSSPDSSPKASPKPKKTPKPTLAPGPGGTTPVFKRGAATKDRTVALTFDADMTADQGARARAGERFDNPQLVRTLRKLRVPATVFMTGRWAEEYPTEAKDIGRDRLFEVANHSYSHYAFTGDCYGLPRVPARGMRADVDRAFGAFRKAGVEHVVPYFRFPGGCYDRAALRALTPTGVTAVQWDVVSGDAFATDADAVARQVLDGVRPGSVVVMHCTRSAAPTTERVVRAVVPKLRAQGYRFVRVSDLVGAARGA